MVDSCERWNCGGEVKKRLGLLKWFVREGFQMLSYLNGIQIGWISNDMINRMKTYTEQRRAVSISSDKDAADTWAIKGGYICKTSNFGINSTLTLTKRIRQLCDLPSGGRLRIIQCFASKRSKACIQRKFVQVPLHKFKAVSSCVQKVSVSPING